MRILLKIVLQIFGLSFLWAIIMFFGTLGGWWHQTLTESDNPDDFFKEAIKETRSLMLVVLPWH